MATSVAVMSDNEESAAGGYGDTAGSLHPIQSELLCFLSDKSSVLPFDDIVKLCVDFYNDNEIMSAKNILESVGHSMHKRKGLDKLRKTVEDMVKVILDPKLSCPTFYAVDLARLPPIEATQCDMSAVLMELRSLRSELRSLKKLEDEVYALRTQVNVQVELTAAQSSELSDLRSQLKAVQEGQRDEFPPLGTSAADHGGKVNVTNYASRAQELHSTGMVKPSLVNAPGKVKLSASKRPTIGASISNKRVSAVKTIRTGYFRLTFASSDVSFRAERLCGRSEAKY